MKNDSHCSKKKYCDFEVIVSNGEIQVERCSFCGKKVRYHKDRQGRIDNQKYLRDHIRHTAQPFGATRKIFEEIYGRKRYLETLAMLKNHKRTERREGPSKYVKRTGWVDTKTKRPI